MEIKPIRTPLDDDLVSGLRSGDKVLLSGCIYTARDAAHKRFMDALLEGGNLPIDVKGQVIYYCGPTPAAPGRVIGSAGPTTSSRMDAYAPALLAMGLKGMIGKGKRSDEVKEAIRKHRGILLRRHRRRRRTPIAVRARLRSCCIRGFGTGGGRQAHSGGFAALCDKRCCRQ